MVDNLVQAQQQLAQLRRAFVQKLPRRMQELNKAAAALDAASAGESAEAVELLGLLAHRLAGTAGTYGHTELGDLARRLELQCRYLQEQASAPPQREPLRIVDDLLEQMRALAVAMVSATRQEADTPGDALLSLVSEARQRRVLLVEDDPVAGEQLASVLPNFGFQVDWRQHPRELQQALESGQPDILLMDIVYPDGRDLGVSAVRELREQDRLKCPVIFVSVRDDLDARLQAARAGCDGFLAKPLDIPDMVETLKHFAKHSPKSPYRVLAVEDDKELINWYRLILGEAGFEMQAVSDPARAISSMREYRPDVILMDIEMPGYNGLELVKVIRQYVEFLQIPVVFVTGAATEVNRMEAWQSGGDDFIAKPVRPEILIPSLRARAEKSRALVSLSVHQKVKASRERFHVLASVSPVATVYTDPQGLCLFVNPRFTSVTGAAAASAFGKHWTHWVSAAERASITERWSEAVDRQEPFEAELQLRGPDGAKPLWVIARASPQLGDEGETTGYAATFTDISELKQAGEELSRAKRMLETTFASMQDAVFLLSEETDEILQVNDAAHTLFGYPIEELKGAPLAMLFPDDLDYRRYRDRLSERIAEYGVFRTDVRMRRKDGFHLLGEHTATPMNHGTRPQEALVLVVRDVTEPRALSEKLAYEASHDSLTGLCNRFELERHVDAALELAASEDAECALCYLDLDRFKLINDSCGHQAGDRVLREIAALLTAQVRQGDTLARIGGDEFAVLMKRCTLEQARRVADSVLRAVAAYRLDWEGKRFSVGISIGMARIGRDSGTISDVLKAVDSACYAAKETGRNRIHVFELDDEQHLRRHDDAHWGMLIERALEEKRFELFMQPISATNGQSQPGEHIEILLRMRGEKGELVCPGNFLPSAEHFHLSTRIDQWVLREVLNWLARAGDQANRLHQCAINLSGQSLADDRFLDYVLQCFRTSSVAPEKICFEVTETAAVSDIVKARRFISRLKEDGCRFALDDFGTGVSNFSYLKDLPVDYLKIDGSFVKDMVVDPLDEAMVRAINEIGHVLGKITIAECVESEAILDRLRAIGVDSLQGFHIGRPEAVR